MMADFAMQAMMMNVMQSITTQMSFSYFFIMKPSLLSLCIYSKTDAKAPLCSAFVNCKSETVVFADVDILVAVHPRTGGNHLAQNDVLLEANQRVDLALDGGATEMMKSVRQRPLNTR